MPVTPTAPFVCHSRNALQMSQQNSCDFHGRQLSEVKVPLAHWQAVAHFYSPENENVLTSEL